MLFERMRRLVGAIAGNAVTELEAAHPVAVLDAERTRLRTQVARYNRGLAAHAAIGERLRRRAAQLEQEQGTLTERITRRLGASDRARAAEAALRLEGVRAELARGAEQLVRSEATYQELTRSRNRAVEVARARIEAMKRSIGEVQAQRALAELCELAADLEGSIGVSEGTLERVHERLEEERELAMGRARVAREVLDSERDESAEEDRAARAEEALRRFEASRASGAAPAAEPPPEPA
jgi:predicted  nucleic acid-binding Zn-ribbon protein